MDILMTPKAPKPPKVLGYVRVSTVRQYRDGLSIEEQTKTIQKYCDMYGLTLLEVHSDGKSGKSVENRLGMKTVLRKIQKKEADGFVIYDLDRFARNTREALEIKDIVEQAGATIHFIKEKIDTSTSSGRLFFTLLAAMAQWQREVIVEKTKFVIDGKKSRKERVSLHAPFGYCFEKPPKPKGKAGKDKADKDKVVCKVVRDLHEQKAWRKMYHMRLNEGMSLKEISLELEKQGFVNRNGKRFDEASILRLVIRYEEKICS
jgi:site-specific DNA recombinase